LITIEGGKLPQIIKQIEGEMIFNAGNLYQRAGSLVRAIHTEKAIEEKGVTIPANSLTIHAINESYLSHHFTKIAKWQKYNARAKSFARIDAPSIYANTYFSLVGDWNLPVLRGITECPTLRRDGSLIRKSGYDKSSGLYVDYQGETVNVLNNPTKQDALDALEILKQPLKDFSFLAEIDRAVILAAMLTAVVNYSIPTTPWFAIDAPIMGSGKSLLADIVSMIATGRKATVISQGNDETEDEKRLGALLMRGVPLLNLEVI
jgi:putative DNA primase/helicase